MSKFVTRIPVDVEAVRALLPKGALVERVRWNAKASLVEVEWDHQPFHSALDFPVAFEQELLEAKKLPKGVSAEGPARKNPTSNTQTPKKPQTSRRKPASKPVAAE